ncbi:MAG TPA: glutaminyl-peptide cyclotransferase, partial [Hanamia sp.]|nr:glutaminyl-peptide cyclotransferase [Hanamia sp.]
MFSKIIPAFLICFLLVSCGDNSSTPDYDSSLPVNNIPPPVQIMYKVVSVYPHDSGAFTQGLEYYGNKLYESTGEYNR